MEGMLDSNGRVVEDGPEPKPVLPGDSRTFRVWLDCNQYRNDMDNIAQNGGEVSKSFCCCSDLTYNCCWLFVIYYYHVVLLFIFYLIFRMCMKPSTFS